MKPDYSSRRDRLRAEITKQDWPNILVTNITNVGYLTGFSGSSAWLLCTPTTDILFSDGRYTEQITTECPDLETRIRPVDSTMFKLLSGVLQANGVASVVIESASVTRSWCSELGQELESIELVDSQKVVEKLRAVKDDYEIDLIRKSIRINETVFQQLKKSLRPDMTEREIGYWLEQTMRSHGADGVSFAPIVASGASSALAHYHGGDKQIGESAFMLVDWGTNFRGYASDLTRMITWGDEPDELETIYEVTLAAQTAAIESIRAGAELTTIDSAARDVIAAAGYGEQFNHGLGHGIGLEIHETPFLSPAFSGELVAGMVITIEPGIYLPGIGGVRIEDDVLVLEEGYEILSSLPKTYSSTRCEFA